MRNSSALITAARHLAAWASLASTAALAANEAETVRQLREQIRALEQNLLIFERRQEIRDEAVSASPPAIVTAGPAGFGLTSADRRYRLRLWANAQADARFFLGDSIEGNDTFLIRRLRLSFEGNLGEKFQYRLMPDFAPATFNLLEAYVTYSHAPAFNLLAGKTKSPFDLERLVSQTDLLFVERAYPTSLAPNRDIGLQIFGEFAAGTLGYQIAWLNGARDNDTTLTDGDDGKEIVARLFAHPFRNAAGSWLQGLGLGAAVSHGSRNSSAPNGFRTNAQQTFFAWRSPVVNDGEQRRFEPQAYFYFGPYGLIGSWVTSRQTVSAGPGAGARELTHTAWYAAASWVLTGEDVTYRGVTPASGFSWRDGTWGAFEVAVRYGEFAVDDDAFPLFANPATSARRARGTTLGLNWHLSRNVKAVLNLEHTSFAGGAGNPVTQENERALLSRLQVRY
jgi:phosphate-selective porin OprO/OprP